MSFAETIIVGNIGRTESVRYSKEGHAVCNFSVAVNESEKNKDGEWQDVVEWYRCVAYQRQAEIVGEHGAKGKQVLVRGRMKTRSYEKDGQTRYVTELRVEKFKLMGNRDERSGTADIPPQARKHAQQGQIRGAGGIMEMDSDIPFACARGLILHSI